MHISQWKRVFRLKPKSFLFSIKKKSCFNNQKLLYCRKIGTNAKFLIILFIFLLLPFKAIPVAIMKSENQDGIMKQRVKETSQFVTTEKEGIHKILHAPDIKTLKKIMKEQEKTSFLKQLCENQKQFSRIPWSCYKLQPFDKIYDPFCLKLKLKDLEIDLIKKALSIKTLSSICRKHLNLNLRILNYRQSKGEKTGSYKP